MVRPKDLDAFSSPRAFYGAELRRLREQAGLSQHELGLQVFCSGTYIGQFETAVRRPQMDTSKQFDDLFESGKHMQRLCRLALEAEPHADYFLVVAELQETALTMRQYSPMVVPGLLQTLPYARGLMSAGMPLATPEEINRLASGRIGRQRRLDSPTGPELWSIVHEAALRTPVGGNNVMVEQLQHLIDVSQRNRRVTLQVVPFSEGPFPLVSQNLILMTFEGAPPAAYTETTHTGHVIDSPAIIAQFSKDYDYARATALSPKASRDFMESIVKDYERA
ncbi:helix-turn-helix transcriptional regulator [Streptomyces sp. RFCAC02]|uniref:helix-turn-helix domain-containing protein n=1 Tax=Streptomyces sp. RFCAC02 TaxID=2499143 RepID=UPI0010210101|nr:helix-turn-helix transcriptional regulator [Streptomyces sp. RFCAC02]